MATERSNIYEGSITLVKIKDGTSGNVITIVGTTVEYALGSNGTVSPTSGWGSAIPEPTDEKRFLWTRSTVTYSDQTELISYSVSYMAKDGADGTDGRDGENGQDGQDGTSVTVASQEVDYYCSSEATAPDINDNSIWGDMPESLELGTYLWARSTVTYSDGTVTRTKMVSYIGTNGQDGTPGTPGQDGTNGKDGTDGKDGQTFYTWIKYSNSSDPQTAADMTDDPAGQSYIGIAYNQLEVTESNDPKDYAWAQIKGPQGEPGAGVTIEQQSITYQIGDSGTEPPSGTWLDAIPDLNGHSERFLWTKTEITYNVEGKNTVSYSVSYIAKNGTDGNDGDDGTTYYTWIKYCDDPTGENPILSDEPQDYKYMGVAHNQTSPTESNNVNDYKWSLIRGIDGKDGEDGTPGTGVTIDSQLVEYVISTSPTVCPGENAGWATNIPTNFTNGDYLWTRTTVIYSDGKKTVAYGVSYLGIDGQNGAPGASAPPVQAQYSPNGSTNWSDTFDATAHKYIRFSYDGGTTWTAGIKIVGEDSNATAYFIETNQEEIKRFVTSENSNGVKTYELSPTTLSFSVYNMPYTSASDPIAFTRFSLAYIQSGTTHYLSGMDVGSYTSFGSQAEASGTSQSLDQNILYFDLKNYLTDKGLIAEDLVIKFSLLDGDNAEIAIKLLPLSNGVNADMATFNLHATGFHAAMQKTSLNFSEKGLSLKNGDFEIVGDAQFEEIGKIDSFEPGQTYYYLNSENEYIVATQYDSTKTYYIRTPERLLYSEGGNLVLKGTIIAKSGEFSGEVNASGGSIGGFDIDEQILSSFGKGPDGTASIILDGTNGTITAQRINLGAEAKIIDKIVFNGEDGTDSAWIFNPQKHKGAFIQAGEKLKISSDGIINLGAIRLDGPNSTISGDSFTITPKLATFSNISCGGKITSVVFEKNRIQAVGGSMIYKPSYKVIETGRTKEKVFVCLEDGSEFDAGNTGDLVWLIDINGEKINDINNTEYTIVVSKDRKEITISPATPSNRVITTLILIGSPEDIIIGLNSSESAIYGRVYGQGLTMQTYNNTKLPEVFLGNLSQLGTAYGGYGLYSQNVYLNGSLTTKVDEDSYAGVNTLSGVNANIFGTGEKDDQSKIVFWAGSDSPEAEDIKIAPFQVTEDGSVYASQARITNSLFAGGSIIGSDIYAARIHGCDPKNEADPTAPAALTIYDSKVGISFKSGFGGEEKESFSINNSGFARNQQSFIELNDEVVFIGSAFRTGTTEKHLVLSQSQINFMSILEGTDSIYSQVAFSKDAIDFSIGNAKQVSISKGATSIFTTLQATGYVHFGENDNYMEYQRQDTGGYDLFISHN